MSPHQEAAPPTGNGTRIIDETTPLIAVANAGPTVQPSSEPVIAKIDEQQNGHISQDYDDDDRPLPKGQILLLCFARLVEPIAFFSIFPFISQMIYDTGDVAKSDVGFYSGLIESLFSLTQMLLMVSWGWAADRYGRKPILIVSNIGVGVAMTLFGFSSNVWQMIIFRCLAGVFSGSVVTIRAMFSELSTPKTQARAFSFFAVAGNVGIFIGPFLGGLLSNPTDQYPGAFGNSEVLRRYPYCLAGIATGALALLTALVCALFLQETLESKENGEGATKPMSTGELLKVPGVVTVLIMYGLSAVVGLGWTAIAPVFWFTPVRLGGYGFSPFYISIVLAGAGLSQALWTLIIFPPLQQRIGTKGILYVCWGYWPISFVVSAGLNTLLRQHLDTAFWILLPLSLAFGSGVSMAFTGIQLAVNDTAPSHQTLGTINALALTLSSGVRAVAPAAFASLYATGVRLQLLGGYFGLAVVFVISVGLAFTPRLIPNKGQASQKSRPEHDEEEA